MTAHNIEWINTTAKTADYDVAAMAHYNAGNDDTIEVYTDLFEHEYGVSKGEDIGGLIVYSNDCVYDYENFCGWVR